MSVRTDISAALVKVTHEINHPVELQTTLNTIVRTAALSLPGIDHVGITVAGSDGQIETKAGSDPFVWELDELQYEVGVVQAFAPLPRKANPAVPTTGYDDVKRIALARLFLDSIPSIQVDWSLYGPKLAQVALTVGADDVDGVSPIDDLSEGRRRAPIEEVRRNIRAAGFEAVERDGRFDVRQ